MQETVLGERKGTLIRRFPISVVSIETVSSPPPCEPRGRRGLVSGRGQPVGEQLPLSSPLHGHRADGCWATSRNAGRNRRGRERLYGLWIEVLSFA